MSHRVLIADPFVPTSGSLRRILESAQFEVFSVHYLDEAVQRIKAADPEVLFASVSSTFDGETLCLKAKELAPLMPVVLVYPPDEEAADEHARNAGADAFMLGPVRRPVVVTITRALLRQRSLQKRIHELESENDKLVAARLARPVTNPGTMPAVVLPAKGSVPDASVPAPDREFEFFKRFLLMEVKRSRRFKHPMSFMLVEVDEFAQRIARHSPANKKAALAETLKAISSGLRDIDLCVPASGDRFLVFLSHTPQEGAVTVAERMRARVGKMKILENATVSVGISSYGGGKSREQVSFGGLMKDASDALKRAKAAGGNRAESSAPVKRDRISLG